MKKIIILLCLLFVSCDTDIPSLPTLDYYCPVENISVEMLDSQNFQLSWEYPPSNSSICGENIGNNFQILYINECINGSSTLNFNSYEVLPVDVSLYSNSSNYFIENDRYYFNASSIQSSSIDDYSFVIKVLYGNNQSLDSESVCSSLNFQAPQIITSDTDCINPNECYVELAPISNIS